MAYRPMLGVMRLLERHGYRIYIVSGSFQEFVQGISAELFGVPPEQVIGSHKLLPDTRIVKPPAIAVVTGHRPAAAFGNSNGGRMMLRSAGNGEGWRF